MRLSANSYYIYSAKGIFRFFLVCRLFQKVAAARGKKPAIVGMPSTVGTPAAVKLLATVMSTSKAGTLAVLAGRDASEAET